MGCVGETGRSVVCSHIYYYLLLGMSTLRPGRGPDRSATVSPCNSDSIFHVLVQQDLLSALPDRSGRSQPPGTRSRRLSSRACINILAARHACFLADEE